MYNVFFFLPYHKATVRVDVRQTALGERGQMRCNRDKDIGFHAWYSAKQLKQ